MRAYLPRLTTDTIGAYALSEAGLGLRRLRAATRGRAARRRLDAQRAQAVDHERRRGRRSSSSSPTPTLRRATRGITAFIVERELRGLLRRQEGRQARHSCLEHLRAASSTTVDVPDANVLGPVGQGYKIAIDTLNGGRIGIGAQMIGVAGGALKARVRVPQGADAVRQAARRVPGRSSSRWRRRPPNSRRRGCWCTTPRASRMRATTSQREGAMAKLFSQQVASASRSCASSSSAATAT